jgi:hypothetical protein
VTGSPSVPERPALPAPDLGAMPVSEWPAGLSQRRHRALDEVVVELGPAHRTDQPAVALRDFGPGCVCLGIAGPVGQATAGRLGVLLGELRIRGCRELVITLAGLGRWHPQLARVLAHARIRHLVDGAHVEFHDLPDALAADLGAGLPTAFLIVDAAPADPPAVPVLPVRPEHRDRQLGAR